ncbi:MAG: C25 family cysteine peptidase [Bacteroidales bacterium]|jgi:gingipain R|nr:C25 family cysteine peptidase [Bacteroidales bacterium]
MRPAVALFVFAHILCLNAQEKQEKIHWHVLSESDRDIVLRVDFDPADTSAMGIRDTRAFILPSAKQPSVFYLKIIDSTIMNRLRVNGDSLPEVQVEIGTPYKIRELSGLPISVSSVRAPAFRYLSITFKISWENVGSDRVARSKIKLTREYAPLYEHHFLNYDENKYLFYKKPTQALIIAPVIFKTEILHYVKKKKDTRVRYVPIEDIGNTALQLARFIRHDYARHRTLFVLLAGKAPAIPAYIEQNEVGQPLIADNVYANVAGEDHYPDLWIGRLPARNPKDLAIQLRRTEIYEKQALHSSVFKIDAKQTRVSPAVIARAFRDSGIIVYNGHGSSNRWDTGNFTVNHAEDLDNKNHCPIVLSASCYAGQYAGRQPCLAEALLQAQQHGTPTGATATLMSTTTQSWHSSGESLNAMLDFKEKLLLEKKEIPLGLIISYSWIYLLEKHADHTTEKTWLLFGDPSVPVFR